MTTIPEEIFNNIKELYKSESKFIEEIYQKFLNSDADYNSLINKKMMLETKFRYISLFLKEFPYSMQNLSECIDKLKDEDSRFQRYLEQIVIEYHNYKIILINDEFNYNNNTIINYLLNQIREYKKLIKPSSFDIELNKRYIRSVKYLIKNENEIDDYIKYQLIEIPEFNCLECNNLKLN